MLTVPVLTFVNSISSGVFGFTSVITTVEPPGFAVKPLSVGAPVYDVTVLFPASCAVIVALTAALRARAACAFHMKWCSAPMTTLNALLAPV